MLSSECQIKDTGHISDTLELEIQKIEVDNHQFETP